MKRRARSDTLLFIETTKKALFDINIKRADLDAGTPLWSKAVLPIHQQHEAVYCVGILLL